MDRFIGGIAAVVVGAALGAATAVGYVQTHAPDDDHALQSTTVPTRTLITNDMHLEMLTRVCEYRFTAGLSRCEFRNVER